MKIIWHHTGAVIGDRCASTQHHDVDIIDAGHAKKWPGFTSRKFTNKYGHYYHCGYHFVIDVQKGIVTQTRDFGEEGAHCIGMNNRSVGVVIVGNYDACSGDLIPRSAHRLINDVWDLCKVRYPELLVSDNVPHRVYSTKSCFGDRYPDDYIQDIIRNAGAIIETEEIKLMKQIIDLLQKQIALLMVRITGKRLSAREK